MEISRSDKHRRSERRQLQALLREDNGTRHIGSRSAVSTTISITAPRVHACIMIAWPRIPGRQIASLQQMAILVMVADFPWTSVLRIQALSRDVATELWAIHAKAVGPLWEYSYSIIDRRWGIKKLFYHVYLDESCGDRGPQVHGSTVMKHHNKSLPQQWLMYVCMYVCTRIYSWYPLGIVGGCSLVLLWIRGTPLGYRYQSVNQYQPPSLRFLNLQYCLPVPMNMALRIGRKYIRYSGPAI